MSSKELGELQIWKGYELGDILYDFFRDKGFSCEVSEDYERAVLNAIALRASELSIEEEVTPMEPINGLDDIDLKRIEEEGKHG